MGLRVLHLLAGAEHGGAETFATELILSLAKRDIEQVVVTRPFAARISRFKELGISWRACSYDRLASALVGRISVQAFLRRYRPDIVQTWMGRPAQMLPRSSVPTLGWMGGYYALKRFARCHHVIGCTAQITAHNISAGLPAWRAHTINTFAMLDKVDGREADARKELDTPADATVLLTLSRLHPKKGIDTLLRALACLPPSFYLWVAGEGKLRGELEQLARELNISGRVRFLGWRSDRATLLAQADICVLPSRYEPFGTVIVEAWQTRTPIVACRATGPSNHLMDRVDGILCDIDDPQDLARGIATCRAQRTLVQEMIKNGYRNYERYFSEGIVAQKFISLYEKLSKHGFPPFHVESSLTVDTTARRLAAAYQQATEGIDDSVICDAYFIHETLQPLLCGTRVKVLSEIEIEGTVRPYVGSRRYRECMSRFYDSL